MHRKQGSKLTQKRILTIATLLAILWYASFFFGNRPTRIIGDTGLLLLSMEIEQFYAELEKRTQFKDASAGNADVLLAVVWDWDDLEPIEGLREFCGSSCEEDSETDLVRMHRFRNLFSYQKITVLRIGGLFPPDAEIEGKVLVPEELLKCLWGEMAKEVNRIKGISLSDGCLKEFFDEVDRSPTNSSRFNYTFSI